MEGDAGDAPELEQMLEQHLPTLNAATNLAHARFKTEDGLVVTVGARCADAPPGSRCVRLWQKSSDDLQRRIRFLAWPFSCAVVLRTERAHLATLSIALRDAVERSSGTIALVVGGEERADTQQVRVLAQRALSLARKHGLKEAALLSALASGPSSRTANGQLTTLFQRSEQEVVVVPRLGGLSRLSEFNRELADIITKLPFQVRYRHQAVPFD